MSAVLLPVAQENIDGKVQTVAIVVTALLFIAVLDLVRRRHLAERYALLWMLVAGGLLALSIWTDLLVWITNRIGVQVPANGLFIAAFGVAFLLLLNFSVATSRLSEETKILAQEVARLDAEVRAGRENGSGPAVPAEDPEHDAPVRAEQRPQ